METSKNIILNCCGGLAPSLNFVSTSINCWLSGDCPYPEATQSNTSVSILNLLEDNEITALLNYSDPIYPPNNGQPYGEICGELCGKTQICDPTALPPFPPFVQCDDITSPELQNGQFYHAGASLRINPYTSSIYGETRIKYRIEHPPIFPSCYLKVWVSKITQKYKYVPCPTEDIPCLMCEELDGPPVKTDEPVYVWESQSCDYDFEEDLSKCEYTIYGPANEVTAGTNEDVSIEIKKYSYVKDYEPENPDQNGEQPCRPNGWPLIKC